MRAVRENNRDLVGCGTLQPVSKVNEQRMVHAGLCGVARCLHTMQRRSLVVVPDVSSCRSHK